MARGTLLCCGRGRALAEHEPHSARPKAWSSLVKAAAVWMLEALRGRPGHKLTACLGSAASYASDLACRVRGRGHCTEACAISEPLCRHLGLVRPGPCPEVPPEKLHRCFRLHTERSK